MCQAFKNDGYPIQAIPLLIQFLLAKDQWKCLTSQDAYQDG
jgi:hypothetical protein